jgi:hypothetical protein
VARLERMPQIQSLGQLEVQVQGGTATLRGVVATEHDRAVIVQLARLEPGIWRVRNEMVVAEAPAAPAIRGPEEASAEGSAPELVAPAALPPPPDGDSVDP